MILPIVFSGFYTVSSDPSHDPVQALGYGLPACRTKCAGQGLGILFIVRGMGAQMSVPKQQNSNAACTRFALSWGP